MFEMIALAAFTGLVVFAACSDMARLIIPNWVSIALATIFPVAALIAGAPLISVGLHVMFGLGVLAVGFVLFQFNIIGGGVQPLAILVPLPSLSDTVTIDGTTQPGFAGTPVIRLVGGGAGATANGLTLKEHMGRGHYRGSGRHSRVIFV